MPSNTKNIFYFDYLQDDIYAEMVQAKPDVRLTRLEYDDPAATIEPVLQEAHVYQITAARDELTPGYFASTELLSRCPNLLVVSSHGAGFDTVDLDACTKAGVIVVNQSGGNKEGVAEHALGMMLTLSKKIIQADRFMRREANIKRALYKGNDLKGKTLGIIGLGNIGTRLTEMVQAALQMRVLTCDPYLERAACEERGAVKVDLETLLREANVVSINCPYNAETKGMIDRERLALMKPEAYLISTARGGIHDEAALHEALVAGRLAGAGLDVWDIEPPPPSHPLLQLDNVLASPHTAGVTWESRRNIAAIAAEQILGIFEGERPPRLLNPAAWELYAERFSTIFGRSPAA